MKKTAGILNFPRNAFEELYWVFSDHAPGEQALQKFENCKRLNPISNSTVPDINEEDCDKAFARNTSTMVPLGDHMDSYTNIKNQQARAIQVELAGEPWLGAKDVKETPGKQSVAKQCWSLFQAGRAFPPRTGHKSFEHTESASLRYFVLLHEIETTTLKVCSSAHEFVDHHGKA